MESTEKPLYKEAVTWILIGMGLSIVLFGYYIFGIQMPQQEIKNKQLTDLIHGMDCKTLQDNLRTGDYHDSFQPNDTITFIEHQYLGKCLG